MANTAKIVTNVILIAVILGIAYYILKTFLPEVANQISDALAKALSGGIQSATSGIVQGAGKAVTSAVSGSADGLDQSFSSAIAPSGSSVDQVKQATDWLEDNYPSLTPFYPSNDITDLGKAWSTFKNWLSGASATPAASAVTGDGGSVSDYDVPGVDAPTQSLLNYLRGQGGN